MVDPPKIDLGAAVELIPHCPEPGCYPIIGVPEDAPEDLEPAGATVKFWLGGRQLLFK